LLTLFGQANKVRRVAGATRRSWFCFIYIFDKSNFKIKTGSSRTAGRHTFVRQQKYAKLPSLSRGLWTFAKGIWLPGTVEETSRPFA
jgi:hypothetical protein